jgi:hypothetical protein
MKRFVFCLAALAAISAMLALPAFECTNEGDAVHMTLRPGPARRPHRHQDRGPALDGRHHRHPLHAFRHYDAAGNQVAVSDAIDSDRVRIAKRFVMREMRGYTVQVEMEQTQGEFTSVIDDIDFCVEPAGSYAMPTHVSEAFLPSYQVLASNFETSYLPTLPLSAPHMLIIGHDLLAGDISTFWPGSGPAAWTLPM